MTESGVALFAEELNFSNRNKAKITQEHAFDLGRIHFPPQIKEIHSTCSSGFHSCAAPSPSRKSAPGRPDHMDGRQSRHHARHGQRAGRRRGSRSGIQGSRGAWDDPETARPGRRIRPGPAVPHRPGRPIARQCRPTGCRRVNRPLVRPSRSPCRP